MARVRYLTNGASHWLANEGCANKLCKTWAWYLSDCIRDVLNLDHAEMNE